MTAPALTAVRGVGPVVASVTVVDDHDDSPGCVAAFTSRHDLDAGVVVCHPQPGRAACTTLGGDLLVALGKHPGGPAAEGMSRRVWELAGLWLRAERPAHLVVMGAHRLPVTRWRELAELTAAAETRLWLVCQYPSLSAAHRIAAAELTAGDRSVGGVVAWPVAVAALPRPFAVRVAFPRVPDVGFAVFRSSCRRLLDPAGFARVDEVFCSTLAAARREARGWSRCTPRTRVLQGPRGEHPGAFTAVHASALLQRHTIDAATAAEVLTRVRAVQAGFCTEGFYLRLDRPSRWPHLPAVTTNLAPRLDPLTVARLRGLCCPATAAAVALRVGTGLGATELRMLRLRDLHDTGSDQHVVAGDRLYRIPTGAAALLRAAVLARRDQPPAAPQPDVVSLLGRDGWLLPGARPDAPLSVRALQQRLAVGADRAGLAVVADPFRHVEVHDLRGAHRLP